MWTFKEKTSIVFVVLLLLSERGSVALLGSTVCPPTNITILSTKDVYKNVSDVIYLNSTQTLVFGVPVGCRSIDDFTLNVFNNSYVFCTMRKDQKDKHCNCSSTVSTLLLCEVGGLQKHRTYKITADGGLVKDFHFSVSFTDQETAVEQRSRAQSSSTTYFTTFQAVTEPERSSQAHIIAVAVVLVFVLVIIIIAAVLCLRKSRQAAASSFVHGVHLDESIVYCDVEEHQTFPKEVEVYAEISKKRSSFDGLQKETFGQLSGASEGNVPIEPQSPVSDTSSQYLHPCAPSSPQDQDQALTAEFEQICLTEEPETSVADLLSTPLAAAQRSSCTDARGLYSTVDENGPRLSSTSIPPPQPCRKRLIARVSKISQAQEGHLYTDRFAPTPVLTFTEDVCDPASVADDANPAPPLTKTSTRIEPAAFLIIPSNSSLLQGSPTSGKPDPEGRSEGPLSSEACHFLMAMALSSLDCLEAHRASVSRQLSSCSNFSTGSCDSSSSTVVTMKIAGDGPRPLREQVKPEDQSEGYAEVVPSPGEVSASGEYSQLSEWIQD